MAAPKPIEYEIRVQIPKGLGLRFKIVTFLIRLAQYISRVKIPYTIEQVK